MEINAAGSCYLIRPDMIVHGRITIQLQYRPQDPHQVTVQVDEETWTLSRDLLEAGTHSPAGRPAGEGSIKVWRHGTFIFLSRDTPTGNTKVVTWDEQITEFLHHTHLAVPVGSEVHEISDEDLEKLLEG